jgi:hypothetical protein
MDSAEELPFAGAHFGTGCGRAGRVIEEEPDNNIVTFIDQEATELIQP